MRLYSSHASSRRFERFSNPILTSERLSGANPNEPRVEQNGCRDRLVWHLSYQERLPLAVASSESFCPLMNRFTTSLVCASMIIIVACDKKKSQTEVDAELYPDQPDGEFCRSLRSDPYRKMTIDFRHPEDLSGIPDVDWFSLGEGSSVCNIQGTTDATITLPSGRIVREEFAIVYVYVSGKRVTRVRADSLGWLRQGPAESRLDKEIALLEEEGADSTFLERRRKEISDWMTNFDYKSEMYQHIGHDARNFRQSFGFFITARIEIGIRYCHQYEITND